MNFRPKRNPPHSQITKKIKTWSTKRAVAKKLKQDPNPRNSEITKSCIFLLRYAKKKEATLQEKLTATVVGFVVHSQFAPELKSPDPEQVTRRNPLFCTETESGTGRRRRRRMRRARIR